MKFSSTKTYSIITICAVVISLIFISTTLRFYNEAVENTEKLKQQKDSTEKINIKLEFNRNLSKADEQLILNENYAEALKAYFTLLNKYAADKEYTSMINARIEQVEILLQRPEINKAVKEYEIIISQNKKQIESLLADLSSKSTHSNTIDSLQKVNEKLVVELNKKTQEAKKKQLIQVITFKNENGRQIHYLGEVVNGIANGGGIGIWNTGSMYKGEWKNNKRHGKGLFEWADGVKYDGDYRDDKRHGEGVYTWPSGEKYTGEWRNDMREGNGVLYDQDGNIRYEGVWKQDKPLK